MIDLNFDADQWHPLEAEDGELDLPTRNQQVLFEFWKTFPDGKTRIRAYGEIIDRRGRKSVIHLPLYRQHVNICQVARWKYVRAIANAKRG